MSQTPPPGSAPRRTPPPDLDALLESLQSEGRPGAPQPSGAVPTAERASGDVTARRVQALIRAFDVLHRQVGAIAAQGETISKVAETQGRDAKAIAELQRNVRYLRTIVIQQLQQGSLGSAALPPMQVKLVVGHLVEQYHQAERDASVLAQCGMLFLGLALGMGIAAGVGVVNQFPTAVVVFTTIALVTLLVAVIFVGLARAARTRAAAARRSMDESTLLRTVGPAPVPEPDGAPAA